jgi:hypothetical protein
MKQISAVASAFLSQLKNAVSRFGGFANVLTLTLLLSGCASAPGQTAWWRLPPSTQAIRFLYGRIYVFAYSEQSLVCPVKWFRRGKPAGMVALQHLQDGRSLVLFSLWDAPGGRRAELSSANPGTFSGRFTTEGTGVHTHADSGWVRGRPYRFFLWRRPAARPRSAIDALYVYDEPHKRWRLVSALSDPNLGAIGTSFVGYAGTWDQRFRKLPVVATVSLWAGERLSDLRPVSLVGADTRLRSIGADNLLVFGDPLSCETMIRRIEKKVRELRASNSPLSPDLSPQLPGSLAAELESLVEPSQPARRGR